MINKKQGSLHFSGQGKDIFPKSDVGILNSEMLFQLSLLSYL